MVFKNSLRTFAIIFALSATLSFAERPWPFEDQAWRATAGASVGTLSPLMLSLGLGYENVIFYVEGMGMIKHMDTNDFWTAIRGNLSWTLFKDLPFNIDMGISGGYQYARAPNKMHQALNKANDKILVFPYNYRETGDISIEYRVHLYGFFTQLTYPVYKFVSHENRNFQWRVGYMASIF